MGEVLALILHVLGWRKSLLRMALRISGHKCVQEFNRIIQSNKCLDNVVKIFLRMFRKSGVLILEDKLEITIPSGNVSLSECLPRRC